MPPEAEQDGRDAGLRRSRTVSAAYGALRWGAALAVLCVLALQAWDGWALLRGSLGGARPLPLALAFVSGFAGLLALPLAWAALLRGAGFRADAPAAELGRIWLLSYLYRYVPGKVMLVAERTRLGAIVGVPPLAGAAITVVESVLVVACGFACSVLALPAIVDVGRFPLVLLALPVAVASAPPLLRVLGRSRIVRRYGSSWPLLTYRDVGAASLLYVAFWLLQGVSLTLLCRGLVPAAHPPLGVVSGLYAFSFTAGVLAFFAPAGIGVREGVLAVGLQAFLAPSAAALLALAARLWATVIELFALALFWTLSRRRGGA